MTRISSFLAKMETEIPSLQVDISVNTLEDSFLRIADDKSKKEGEEPSSPRKRGTAYDEAVQTYLEVETKQSCCQMVFAVFRLRMTVLKSSQTEQFTLFAVPLHYAWFIMFVAVIHYVKDAFNRK